MQFRVLAGIIAIYIFIDIFSKANPSVFPRNYFTDIVKSIVTLYSIIMISLKSLLL